MPRTSSISTSSLYALSKFVSNSGLQRIMFDDEFEDDVRRMKKLLIQLGSPFKAKTTLGQIVDEAYAQLLKHYRHEYIYKTALLNSYILKSHSLQDSILLNEFKIGQSKADAVLVNGRNKVFEIKTELDSPDRLSTQVADYYRAFSEVYIVVHQSHCDKYTKFIEEKVGIMVFNDNKIETIRPSLPDLGKLEIDTMVRALRKEEVLSITEKLWGEIPNVKSTVLFKTCLNILERFGADEVQIEFLKAIKERINPILENVVRESRLPECLKLPCYYSNMTQNQFDILVKKLNHNF